MANPESLTDDPMPSQDEQLVAYLDGELEGRERAALERRLLDEPTLRLRLKELQSAWEMLDHLPSTDVGEAFTRTTLEMAVASQSQAMPVVRRMSKRPVGSIAIGLAVCLAALVVGWGWERSRQRRALQRQLSMLPAAQFLDAFRYADDIDDPSLLNRLADDPQWREMIDLGIDFAELQVGEPRGWLGSIDHDARVVNVRLMDDTQQTVLSDSFDRLEQLSSKERQQVIDRSAMVSSIESPRRERILGTMLEYSAFLNRLSSTDVAAIRDAPNSGRYDAIMKVLKDQRTRWVSQYVLSDADKDQLVDWIAPLVRKRVSHWNESKDREKDPQSRVDEPQVDQFVKQLRQRIRRRRDEPPSEQEPFPPRDFPSLTRALGGWAGPRRDLPAWLDDASEKDLQQLRKRLSPEALKALESVPEAGQKKVVAQWYWSLFPFPGRGAADRFRNEYLKMDPQLRDRIDLLPPRRFFTPNPRRETRPRGPGGGPGGGPGNGAGSGANNGTP
jgi:hypothetical protein